ncbi:hypothetical protein GH714_011213 [Hevea brasiliensis]|uniref:Bidirectional sugar transporter SWEET n=1 Tax=Hevea brasiliensis TaxID=3981 RepID=A0A6A6MLU5_HEVBR|nr:hypothetical protein GH714_011213 [Hevea brasiliensis]
MVSSDTARNVVGIFGRKHHRTLLVLIASANFYSNIEEKGSGAVLSGPIPCTLINCMVWVLYGLPMVHPNSLLVITINGSGTFIEFLYIILFIIYSDKKKRVKLLLIVLVELIFIAALTILVLTLAHTTKKRSMTVGFVCICFNIMMYASPLSVMIPNGLGSVFALAQLALYAVFYKATKRQMAAREEKSELGLSEVVVNGDSKRTGTGTAPLNGLASEINRA